MNFADRLILEVQKKGNPCVVGLDPRIEMMPSFIRSSSAALPEDEAVRSAIREFHRIVVSVIGNMVPAVKLQIAFYEQYGIPGLLAFQDTIHLAREAGLIVIVDAKRNDIASTAEAYANAFLGEVEVFGKARQGFDVDCITVSPFLGRDSLEPFVSACCDRGKGIFILVKTSNPGSEDFQDQPLESTGAPLYESIANYVADAARAAVGESGYSSVGAVVGATFPEEARRLRTMMPQSIILVPGYGAQGGSGSDTLPCFNLDGLGAVVNASRSVTYAFSDPAISREGFVEWAALSTGSMIDDISGALAKRNASSDRTPAPGQ